MKSSTFNKLYEDALIEAERKKKAYGNEVEVVLVPIIIDRDKNGRVGSISGVNHKIIIDEENGEV